MSTTTFTAIRAQQVSVLRALLPSTREGERFEMAPTEELLEVYAAREESMAAVFRQFQIRDNHDTEPVVYCDLQTIRVAHTMNLDIAYPKLWAKYGRDNVVSMDDVVRSDFHQIDRAIGLTGNANWLAGQHICEHVGGSFFDLQPSYLHRIVFRVEYERALP